jgi:hypothetical protein
VPKQSTGWRNRITGYAEVDPADLLANPLNYRIHPRSQQDALKGVISDIGFIDPVIVQQGTDTVIDGHLRVTLALRDNIPTIPVQYVDLTDAEAAEALATIDPLSAMAVHDADKLRDLLDQVSTGDAAVMQMLSDLAEDAGVVPPDWSDAFGALPDGDKAQFEQMTFTLSTAQAELVREAMDQAKHHGDFGNTGNENSNGNALARICEAYVNAA